MKKAVKPWQGWKNERFIKRRKFPRPRKSNKA